VVQGSIHCDYDCIPARHDFCIILAFTCFSRKFLHSSNLFIFLRISSHAPFESFGSSSTPKAL
jgi:hypothetical protein